MRIAILGHHAIGRDAYDGQTIKTRQLSDALIKHTQNEVINIDTAGWKKHPIRLFCKLNKAIKECDVIIILPAHNGVKVFSPIINMLNKKRKCRVYYDVIGGWLPQTLRDNHKLKKQIAKFNSVWVETAHMATELQSIGLDNCVVVNNFKDIDLVRVNKELIYNDKVKRLCTFSRVNKLKGIGHAIQCVVEYNRRNNFDLQLDIYGAIESDYQEEFDKMLSECSHCVNYKGKVAPNKSAEILSNYSALLFPTLYYTEGQPGTIIDCFFAGLPIISSKFKNHADMLNTHNSILYEFGDDTSKLYDALQEFVAIDIKRYIDMAEACYDSSIKYSMLNTVNLIESIIQK